MGPRPKHDDTSRITPIFNDPTLGLVEDEQGNPKLAIDGKRVTVGHHVQEIGTGADRRIVITFGPRNSCPLGTQIVIYKGRMEIVDPQNPSRPSIQQSGSAANHLKFVVARYGSRLRTMRGELFPDPRYRLEVVTLRREHGDAFPYSGLRYAGQVVPNCRVVAAELPHALVFELLEEDGKPYMTVAVTPAAVMVYPPYGTGVAQTMGRFVTAGHVRQGLCALLEYHVNMARTP